MKFNPDKHRRRSIRLKGYDYSQPGAYFVTICTKDRECLFGNVVDGEMRMNDAGQNIALTWATLPERFSSITVDEFVVMPNHFHGIVILMRAQQAAPLPELQESPASIFSPNHSLVGAGLALPSLGDVVRTFKSISAIMTNRTLDRIGRPLWQRNYYEHVIRDDESLGQIRQYIADNPARWASDPENLETIETL